MSIHLHLWHLKQWYHLLEWWTDQLTCQTQDLNHLMKNKLEHQTTEDVAPEEFEFLLSMHLGGIIVMLGALRAGWWAAMKMILKAGLRLIPMVDCWIEMPGIPMEDLMEIA